MVNQSQKPEIGSVLDTLLIVFKCDSRVTTVLFFLQCIKDYWRNQSLYLKGWRFLYMWHQLQNQSKNTRGKGMSSRCECKHSTRHCATGFVHPASQWFSWDLHGRSYKRGTQRALELLKLFHSKGPKAVASILNSYSKKSAAAYNQNVSSPC